MKIYQKTKKLVQQKQSIFVRWIPSQSEIERNEKWIKAAKKAAIREKVQMARWTRLTNIKWQIKEMKNLQISVWNEQKAKKQKVSRRRLYISFFNIQIHLFLGKTKKIYASRFYQLKTRNDVIATFLKKNKSNKVCRMLVMRRQKAINYSSLNIMSKVEDRTPSFEENSG